jgi:hypothetical protein
MEKLTEQLYEALTDLLHDNRTAGLLTAVGDAQARVPFERVSPKTRALFRALAENLTTIQARG